MPNDLYFESWGRFPKLSHLGEISPSSVSKIKDFMESADSFILPRGLGRSYGDSCLNEDGYLLSTKYLDKFSAFDPGSGLVKCEAGVTLDEIIRVFVPMGWFLPVTPGTKFVTLGGAIANDIHGKNHHKSGTFGNCVRKFELLRSNGERLICSRDTHADWFRATIGGLGLTGIILWAEILLKPIKGPFIDMESIKFNGLSEFFEISRQSEQDYEYIISWLDCMSNERGIKGIFMRGNHSEREETDRSKIIHKNISWKTFPFDAPSLLLSTTTTKMFNYLYYNRQKDKVRKSVVHYDPFFYPLDSINNWNRMYGKKGFLQWQCVVPEAEKDKIMQMILRKIIKSKLGSFLVVLKEFGSMPVEGTLSFPMPGTTLALDFPNKGKKLFDLLDELDEVVIGSGGRLYPAKDARMSGKTFRSSFPEIENYNKYIDPKFSSSFYRRVGG